MVDAAAPRPPKGPGVVQFRVDINTLILALLLGLTTWGATQFIEVRDTVRALNVTVPLEFQSLDTRVRHLEERQK